MGIYRKKPVEVEAYRWTGSINQEPEPVWASEAMRSGKIVIYRNDPHSAPEMLVSTLEGTMLARIGDYIIRGVKGEIYPCKPDIFAETYEKVEDEISN